MEAINYQTIKSLAIGFARNIHLWLGGETTAAAWAQSSPERLAAVLEPGIAAFIGRLTTLIPEQHEALPGILIRYFALPATADAFGRLMNGRAEAGEDMAALLIAAGAVNNARLSSYFFQALDSLIAAVALSAASDTAEEAKSPPADLGEMADSLHLSPYLLEDIQAFVAGMNEIGLDRIEMGAAVAADGETLLFAWEPLLMSAGSPDEMPFAGAEESAGETPPPPPPSPEPIPANGGSGTVEVVELRLDTALPERVTVGRVFELAVAIMRPASPPRAIDDLARRESAGFAALWPDGAAFVQLRVQISAPDCEIHDGDSRPVRLLAGQDGPTVYFQLTPQRPGPLSVIITVYQEMDWVGSTRLRTEAAAEEMRGTLAVTIPSQHPLGSPEVNQVALWKAISEGYNDSELRDLCFILEIDYEDLAGETKSAKARELVLKMKRIGQLSRLVEQLMAERPHLLA